MDHLPTGSPYFRHIPVPYIFSVEHPYIYDNAEVGQWSTFAIRNGWGPGHQLLSDDGDYTAGGTKSLEEANSMLQAWLYFGFLHLATGSHVTVGDFVHKNEYEEQFVTTRKLPLVLKKYRDDLAAMAEPGRSERVRSVDNFLRLLVDTCYQAAIGWSSPLPAEVILSMIILKKTVTYAKLSILPNSEEPAEEWYGNSAKLVHDLLRANHWCPSDIYRFHQQLSSLAQYYVVSLGSRRVEQNHSRCTNVKCNASQFNVDSAVQRHVASCGGCKPALVDKEKLCEIIRGKDIPVVTYSTSMGLRLQPFDPHDSQSYVAISHVWSDGLGNPDENSMLQCQLKRLQSCVNAVTNQRDSSGASPRLSPTPRQFWIDTLCIPAKEDCIEKTEAVGSMARIYKTAEKVLVLDSEMDLISSTSPAIEIATRIIISPWWTRLWTLQEGMYAKELWFQLKDAAVNESLVRERSQLCETVTQDGGWDVTHAITEEALGKISALSRLDQDIMCDGGRYLLQTVNWRNTSRPGDETICLAILLLKPKDVKELEKIPVLENEEVRRRMEEEEKNTTENRKRIEVIDDPTEKQAMKEEQDRHERRQALERQESREWQARQEMKRMKLFIKKQIHFPSIVLFVGRDSVGSMDEDGFRWAPKKFVGRASNVTKAMLRDPLDYHRRPQAPDIAFADEDGLHVPYPGLELILKDGYHIEWLPGKKPFVAFLDETMQRRYEITMAVPPDSQYTWEAARGIKEPAVILPRPNSIARDDRSLQGVLVNIYNRKNDELFARYLCPVLVNFHQQPVVGNAAKPFETNKARLRTIDMGQKWCVG